NLSSGNLNKSDVVFVYIDITKLHLAHKNYDAFPNEYIKYNQNLTIKSVSI
ncbi:carbon-nitrogen hydrolase, partial [Francisella tularensis subsp. holarctica]|nr:carbon-nitrogen hydrolase [Francisella tularensis subsp. holarctica]